MKNYLFCTLLVSLVSLPAISQQYDEALTAKLQQLFNDSKIDAGIYVRHLTTGAVVEIKADTLFPTASMIKVPIMCGTFSKIEKGELKYDEEMTYLTSLMYTDDDIVGKFRDSSKIDLAQVIWLMESVSDNTASLWCQALAGGAYINEWLEDNGFKNIRVNSRVEGREGYRSIYGWGYTSPRDMAELLALIRAGKAISPAASERMYRILSKSYWDDRGLSQLPPYVNAASKQGFVRTSTSEVVLVNAPHGDYVYCIATKNQQSRSAYKNEGTELLRQVSKLLWEYYEPDYGWSPAAGIVEKYTQ